MSKLSIIPDKIRDFEYYKSLLPMYLRTQDEFLSHFYNLFRLGLSHKSSTRCSTSVICSQTLLCGESMSSICSTAEDIFSCLDIFNRLNNNVINVNGDVLDKLAALFGVARHFSIVINKQKKDLHLSDDDLTILIKCQVIKNFFSGTFEELRQCYALVDLPVAIITRLGATATCNMYMLLSREDEVSENVKDMFCAGLLTIESMGITYTYAINIAESIALFDSTSINATFDHGQFII